ncbi:MAG: hypothetical protein R3C12_05965 [Planctomycetaceae bacterium]
MAIACLGGNEQLAQCISFVNQQVARNLPEQKCEIDRSHLAWASRDREGAIAAFQYTPGPVGGQYPFGEIKVRLSPLGVVSVMESRFWLDADTVSEWGGTLVQSKPSQSAPEADGAAEGRF